MKNSKIIFKDIVYQVRENYPKLLSKSNVTYRNGSKIMEIFGFILKKENPDNSLSKKEALSLGMNNSPSYWAQISRFITGFNMHVKSYSNKSTEFKLNTSGIELRDKLISKFDADTLINWRMRKDSRNLPEFVKKKYQECFLNTSLENITDILKTCFCAISAASRRKLYKQNKESEKPKTFEKEIADYYFDLSLGNNDLKWIGWIAAILQDLGIVSQIPNTNFFELTKNGELIIDNIVEKWDTSSLKKFDDITEKNYDNITQYESLYDELKKNTNRKYTPPNKTEKKGLITNRVGQGWFKRELLERWKGKCSVTNCSTYKILIASHIVPWSESEKDRLNPGNGLLLSPNLDALFDRHLISFNEKGEIIISKTLNKIELKKLGIHHDMKLTTLFEDMKPFLKKHRKKFSNLKY